MMDGTVRGLGVRLRDALVLLLAVLLWVPGSVWAAEPRSVAPGHGAPAALELLAVGGLLAGAAHVVDDPVRDGVKDLSPFDESAKVTNVYGASVVLLPAAALLWSAGCLSRRPGARTAGSELTRTLLVVQALVGPTKWLSGRRRPDGGDHRSFPSGHAANAFAVARLAQVRYGPRAGVCLSAVATLTALGRLADDRHYLSDVVMGGVAGTLAAEYTIWATRAQPRLTLVPSGSAHGLVLAYAFY